MKNFKIFLCITVCNFLFLNLYAQCPPGGASAGTVSVNGNGGTDIPFVVCFGDAVDVTNNGDAVLPLNAEAGLMFAYYTCPPSLTSPAGPDADPCWNSSYWTGADFQRVNDGGTISFLGQNTFWVAPIAADNQSGPSHDSDGDMCFDVNIGEAIMFTFLNELVINETAIDECAGEVTLEITGGYPELFGGIYSVNYTGGGFFTQSGANGEIITITGLLDGDSYALDVMNDGAGCTASFSGGPISQGVVSPTVSYPPICYNGAAFPLDASPPNGEFMFTSPPGDGAFIDAFSGEITGATMNYDVTYTVNGDCGTFSVMTTVVVSPQVFPPVIPSPNEFCESDNTLICPVGIGAFYSLYENNSTNNALWTGDCFNMSDFLSPGDGAVDFYVSQTLDDGCESDRELFSVEIFSELPPEGSFEYVVCEGESVSILPVSASGNSPGEFNFYSDLGLTDLLTTGDSYNFIPTANGSIFITENNNGCLTEAMEVNIIVNPYPIAIADNYICDASNETYSVTIISDTEAIVDAINISIGAGTVVNNLDSTFTINNIPSGTSLLLDLMGVFPTSCESSLATQEFGCGCLAPAAPTNPTNFNICSNDTLPNLSVTVAAGVTVNWYDAPTGGILLFADTTIYAPPAAGTYYAEAVAISDDCVNTNRTPVVLTINPMLVEVSVDTTCSIDLLSYTVDFQITNADTIQVSAGTVSGGSGNFTVAGIPTGMDLTYTAFNVDSTCVLGPLVINSPSCPCPLITPLTTGPDQMICDGDPVPELSVTVGLNQVADWYDAAVAGSSLAGNSLVFTPSAAGTYYVEARDTINNCVSTRDSITIISHPLPTFTLIGTTCAADLMSYTVRISTTNTDVVAPSAGTLVDDGGGDFSITNIPVGMALSFTLTNNTTSCSDMFMIIAPDCSCMPVNAPLSAGDTLICTGSAIPTLEMTVDAMQTVDWYDAATGGTLLLASSTTFTPAVAGTYYAEARVIADGCISSVRTPVTLTIETTPTLVSTMPSCAPNLQSYSVDLQIDDAATLTIEGTGTISNNGGGSFTVTGIPIGENLIYTAFNASGNCSFGPGTVVAIECPCPFVVAPIVSDTMICEGEPVPTLEAVAGMDETIDWYDAASGGTLLLGNSLTFTPTVPGTYFLETRNTINNCVSERVSITITRNPLPTITTSSSACAADLLTYNVNITVANVSIILADVGSLVPDVDDPANFDITGIPAGVDLTLILTNSVTGCELVEIIPAEDCNCPIIPAPISQGDITICSDSSIPALLANAEAGQVVNWYDAATGGTLLLANSNSFTPTIAGTYFAEAQITADGCVSERTAISLEINTQPVLVSEAANCAPDLLTYTVELQITDAITLDNDMGTLVDNTNGSFTISAIPAGMNLTYTAFNIDSSCTLGPIIVTAPDCSCPIIAMPVPDMTSGAICDGDAIPTFTVTAGIDQTADWYDAPVGGNLELGASLTFTPTTTVTVYVEARDTITNCISERVAVDLLINPIPSFVVSDNSCADNLQTYQVTIAVTDADEVNATMGTVVDNADGTFTISAIPAGEDIQISLLNTQTNCEFSEMIVAPDCSCPEVNAPLGINDLAICQGEAIPSFEATVDVNQTVDWYDASSGGNQILAASTTFTPTAAGTFYAETRNTITGCISSTRTVANFAINENPVLAVTNFTLPSCNEEDGSIDLEATAGLAPYTYQLNNEAFQNNPFYSNLAANSYDIIVEDENGCRDSLTQNLVSPEDVFADAGENMELTCEVTSVTLDGSASDQGVNIIYQWLDPDGNPIPDATNNQLTVEEGGTYTLMVSNTVSGCERTSTVLVVENNELLEVEAGEQQNLTCDSETVNLVGMVEGSGTFEFQWTAIQGGNILGNSNALSITADATGLYFLSVLNTDTGCPGRDSVMVVELLPEDLDVTIEAHSPACLGDGDGRISVQSNNPDATLLFALDDSPFTASAVYSNLAPGNYTLHIQDAQGCLSDSLITIERGTEILLDLGDDKFIILGDSILLGDERELEFYDLATIKWSSGDLLSCDTCLETYTHNLQETTLFTLQLIDSLGCAANDDIRVFVDRKRHIFVPNAFSPNGDDSNELLMVFGGNDVFNIKSFRIFDRWGEIVFEQEDFFPNDPNAAWNGRGANNEPLNSAVYVYVLEVNFVDGKTETFAGDIILLK